MIVKSILDDKGHHVIKIMADASIKDLIATLCDNKVGAIVVHDHKDKLIGIVSERDIVRALHKNEEAALNMTVNTIMTKKPSTCAQSDHIDHVMDQMTQGRFRHLPVVEDGVTIAMVSIGDVVKAKIKQTEAEKEQLIDYMSH